MGLAAYYHPPLSSEDQQNEAEWLFGGRSKCVNAWVSVKRETNAGVDDGGGRINRGSGGGGVDAYAGGEPTNADVLASMVASPDKSTAARTSPSPLTPTMASGEARGAMVSFEDNDDVEPLRRPSRRTIAGGRHSKHLPISKPNL